VTAAKNFLYLSEIISKSVYAGSSRIGRIADLVASTESVYPKITGIIIKNRHGGLSYCPWSAVGRMEIRSVLLTGEIVPIESYTPAENDLFVKKTLWDRQIVDTKGLKLVRVNDVHLLREDPGMWLVHIDVGFSGILRRLGWLPFIEPVVKWLFSMDLSDRLIQWKHVQLVSRQSMTGSLSVNIPTGKLSAMHPADIADIIGELGLDERISVFRSLDHDTAVKTMQEFPAKMQKQIFEAFDDAFLVPILSDMPADEIVDLLLQTDQIRSESILSAFPPDKCEEIRTLMEHSARSAGSIMNTDFISGSAGLTVGEALNLLRTVHARSEVFYYFYVTDDNNRLTGVVTLRQILTSDGNLKLADIMHSNVVTAAEKTHIKKVARLFLKYDFKALPIVAEDGTIHGLISIKDAFSAVFPEMTEDEN
jgi:CBS domain-containing protein